MHPRLIHLSLLAVTVLGATGCGSAERVTLVDPNPDTAYTGLSSGSTLEPVVEHGVDALGRARAITSIRAALATARTLHGSDDRAAAAAIETAITIDLPRVEPRLARVAPPVRQRLRAQLERLRQSAELPPEQYNVILQRTSSSLLDQVSVAVIPAAARQDSGFRAAVVVESIQDAAIQYDVAFAGSGDTIEIEQAYRTAYGLLLDARTRGMEAVPQAQRTQIQSQLTKIANRALPGPTPTTSSKDPADVMSELQDVADAIAAATGIDTTWPAPNDNAPDQIRVVKRDLATALEASTRGDEAAAQLSLDAAAKRLSSAAGASIAAVDFDLLIALERGVSIELPEVFASGADAAAIVAELDVLVDDAVGLVETELEQLRDAE